MDHFDAQRQRLRSLFGVFFAPEVLGALLSLARPALRLGGEGGVPVRFGGTPLLPPGEPWPVWDGRPLAFLGAVDFAKLTAALGPVPGLPGGGSAAFYYANGAARPWGDDPSQRDGWRVFAGDLSEVEAPPDAVACPQCLVGAAPFLSLPSPQELAIQRLEQDYPGTLAVYEQLYVSWAQHAWPDDTPVHQLGGWPALVRRPVGTDCLYASSGRPIDLPEGGLGELPEEELAEAERWRLLLQLDSDARLGWHWGDPGRVYFCTHQDQPLERTWLTVQSLQPT